MKIRAILTGFVVSILLLASPLNPIVQAGHHGEKGHGEHKHGEIEHDKNHHQVEGTEDHKSRRPGATAKKEKEQAIKILGEAHDLEIKGRKVTGENNVIRVKQGDLFTIRWTTDEAASLHLHGYDVVMEVKPGKQTVYPLKAYAAGRFPITSHGFGGSGHGHEETTLAYLEVMP